MHRGRIRMGGKKPEEEVAFAKGSLAGNAETE
jgi:hypothetical protein